MSAAFWYPLDGKEWHGSGHYTINCDWTPLDISSGSATLTVPAPSSSRDVTGAFALLFSVASLCISVYVAYRISKPNNPQFIPMENL